MHVLPASPERFSQAIALLEKNGLPTKDISPGTQLFVAEENGEMKGTIAVEYDFNDALLRSLCVDEHNRSKGTGEALVRFIEDYVQQQGIQNIYLLTTTAMSFFSRLGYRVVERHRVASFIQTTSEFTSVCPASATVMVKSL